MTLAFPGYDSVVADIVLIAWKRVDTLRACLESLLAMTDAPSFAVRIAANGATDEVRAFLHDEVSGVTVVDLAENIGFGGGCNAAAAESTADFLVFLNDDAVVSDGWLRALVSASDGRKAVGSLLLDPDGTVQEAGARILPSGDPMQFGAGLTVAVAAAHGYLAPREIDYASAAALLVPREAFVELDGFDTIYRPAYYEDVDLCLRLRAFGYALVLEPDARVTHAAGASTSDLHLFRDFASQHAHDIFVKRWSATLQSAAPRDAEIARLATVVDRPRNEGASKSPLCVPDGAETAMIAKAITADYISWLEAHLTHEADRAAHEAALRKQTLSEASRAAAELDMTRARNQQVERRLVEETAQVRRLEAELAAAHALGPLDSARRWLASRRG